MITIIILVAFFILFFFLKKHTGVAILAACAGAFFYSAINGFFITIHDLTHLQLDVIENIAFVALVVALPFLAYIFSNRSWSPAILRIVSSVVLSATITTLCASFIKNLVSLDTLSNNILSFLAEYRGFILTASVAVAYLDIFIFRGNKRF